MRGLASVAWLAERLGKPAAPRVVDATWFLPNSPFASSVTANEAHEACRIAGATYWDLDAISEAEAAPNTPHNLPTPAQFARAAAKAGITPGAQVVCYDQVGVFSSPRLWHTMRSFGVDAYVLDGGLPAWLAAGYATESGPCITEAGPLSNFERDDALQWRLDDVKNWLDAGGPQLLDARPAGRFYGNAPEPRAGCRSGHAPGMMNTPFLDLLDKAEAPAPGPGGPFRGATLKSVKELRAILEGHGVSVNEPSVATCGSGLTAAVVALALNECGAAPCPVYDGAWCEYEASGLPVISE